MKKTVSIVVPTYNEEINVELMHSALQKEFKTHLNNYEYEIIFIDNCSRDNTRKKLIGICRQDKRTKAIFNAKNFGQLKSPYYGLMQATGDCAVLMVADFQDPVEMIHKFVAEWEQGYKIVIGIKNASKESWLMYFLRTCYYRVIRSIASTEQIEHFTGFGLYDKDFLGVLRELGDPMPYLRGIVAEIGFERKEIPFEQARRAHGRSSNNFFSLYDVAMIGITSYSRAIIRVATMAGFLLSAISFAIGLVYLVLKLVYWDRFAAGTTPLVIGMFFMGSIQLLFLGLIGEYVLSINTRVMRRPLVVEQQRINF